MLGSHATIYTHIRLISNWWWIQVSWEVSMAEWSNGHFGVLEVPGWNPSGVGARCWSRATSWLLYLFGTPCFDSYLFIPIIYWPKLKCSKICSVFGISYVSSYISNTCSPFMLNYLVQDWPSLRYEWYHVQETTYATSTTTYCEVWQLATVAPNSKVTAKLSPQSYPHPKYKRLCVLYRRKRHVWS